MAKLRLLAGSSIALGGLLFLLQTQLQMHNLSVTVIAAIFMLLGIVLAFTDHFRRRLPVNWLLIGVLALIGFLSTFLIRVLMSNG